MKYLFILLIGCGVQKYDNTCQIDGIKQITSEVPLNCELIQMEVDLAKAIAYKYNLIPASKFNNAFKDIPIRVEDLLCLEYKDGSFEHGCITGYYYSTPSPNIVLSKARHSLLHEMLHHWDSVHLSIGTFGHENWDKNGYYDACQEYQNQITILWENNG